MGAIGALGVALAPHARAMPFPGAVVKVTLSNIVARVTTPLGNTCNVNKGSRTASAILGDSGYVKVTTDRDSASCPNGSSSTIFFYRFYIQAASINNHLAANVWCSDMELDYYHPNYGSLTLGTLPRPTGLWFYVGGPYSASFPRISATGARGYVTASVKVTQ